MTNFCANCGAATGGGKFCPKCGSPQTASAATSSAAQTAYAPVRRKSHVFKIILITLALLFVLGIAGLVRGYYYVKERLLEAKQEMAKTKIVSAQQTQAGCALLGKEKVSDILGTTVARTEGNEVGDLREYCNYLSKANVAADTNKNDESKEDGQPGLKDLAALAKKISAAAANRPLLSVQIYRGNAAAAIIGLKTVSRLTGNQEPSVPGPWDEAYFGPMDSSLAVRKGDNGFLLDLTLVEKKRQAGLEIAKAMVQGL